MSILKGNLSSDYLDGEFQKYLSNERKILDRTSGFKRLDECQIMNPGLYVIGGEPGSGKSTFVGQLVEQMLVNNPHECVIHVDYELTKGVIHKKIISRYIYQNIPQTPITEAQMSEYTDDPVLLDAIEHVKAKLKMMLVVESPGKRQELMNLLYTAVAKFKEIDPLIHSPIVVVDYLQHIPHKDTISVKTNIDQIMNSLQEFYQRTNATVFIISSLNRQGYENSLKSGDMPFKESGNIEYDAAVGWIIRCEKDDPEHSTFILKNKKARGGIEGYTLYFDYYHQHNTFVECDNPQQKSKSSKGSWGNPKVIK